MTKRRTLVEEIDVLEPRDQHLEKQFVYGGMASEELRAVSAPAGPSPAMSPVTGPSRPPDLAPSVEKPTSAPFMGVGRVPVGARVRTPLAVALKRASLERQLQGLEPHAVQDILENALEAWLGKHGYLNEGKGTTMQSL